MHRRQFSGRSAAWGFLLMLGLSLLIGPAGAGAAEIYGQYGEPGPAKRSRIESQSRADFYVRGLMRAMRDIAPQQLEQLRAAHGASQADLDQLVKIYPRCPRTLIDLLRRVDGTYHRQYGDRKISVYLLGSDLDGGYFPYYLLSTATMIASSQSRQYSLDDIYSPELARVDARFDRRQPMNRWLHFADCRNNGGSSMLFIDFAPAEGGVVGQVIRLAGEEDDFAVIADSFDDYLRRLMEEEYLFLQESDY